MKICLITPFHVAFQPRTVREADTLAGRGHDVRVVSCTTDPALVAHDERLVRGRTWRHQAIDLRRRGASRQRWLRATFATRVHRVAFGAGLRTGWVAARAYLRGFGPLVRAAAGERADWYIAHSQPALAVAAAAAERWSARLGFDCEDLLSDAGTDPSALVRSVECRYLPGCDYVSAPSRAIASELVARYRIPPPVVLHNVFPLRLADGMEPPKVRDPGQRLRLHWSGQTIGAGRGLEEAIDAAGRLSAPVEIHLRGRVAPLYAARLSERAASQRTPPLLTFHPLLDHDDVIRAMAGFDVGLCLERPENGNFARTVTNKLFSYLLAGLAVAATDTMGQREIASEIPQAHFLYPSGDVDALVKGLSHWQCDAEALLTARRAAWDAARQRYSWDFEAAMLLSALEPR